MEKGGMRLVSVVMGAESPTLRNQDAVAILNYGFNNYDLEVIYEKGTIIEVDSDILVNPATYHIVTSDDIVRLNRKNSEHPEITHQVEIYRDKIRNLQKDQIGIIKTYSGGELLCVTDLELVETPKKATFIELLITIFKSLF